jgi:hypothetical protein
MGLLMTPFRGLLRVFEEVAEQAEQELYNEDAVKAELMDLYKRLEAGALSEQDFVQHEVALVQRLEEIEERNQRRAGHGAR